MKLLTENLANTLSTIHTPQSASHSTQQERSTDQEASREKNKLNNNNNNNNNKSLKNLQDSDEQQHSYQDNDTIATMLTVPTISTVPTVTHKRITELFELPFLDLVMQAQTIHRENFDANKVQISTLLSIKTGNCPEDCGYCSQSVHYRKTTKLQAEKRLEISKVINKAKQAKRNGSSRFCMGAAWKHPSKRDMPYVVELIKEVKSLGMETCMTLGTLQAEQAETLAEAGLDYYNHNLDTSRNYYKNVVSTRSYDERLETIAHVQKSGIHVCSGSIVGMGESREDRIDWIYELAKLPSPPQSIPVNLLVPIQGTPIGDKILAEGALSILEWIRTIAVSRICFPQSYVRLSAGRESLSDGEQALAFMAGANSFFYGDKLLTTGNASQSGDKRLMAEMGMTAETVCSQKMGDSVKITDASTGCVSEVVR